MRMLWIDRLAIVWACVIAFLFVIISRSPTGNPSPDAYAYLPYVIFWATVPPWLLLRGLYWVVHPHGS